MAQLQLTFESIGQRALEIVVDALVMAGDDSRDDPGIVHDLRVTGKRLRAWWRLMRAVVSDKDYQAADHRLRQIGQLLASDRDRYVQQRTLDRLATIGQEQNPSGHHVVLLQAQWADAMQQTVQSQTTPDWGHVIQLLHAESDRWQSLALESLDPSQHALLLADSIKRTYRKVRTLGRAVAAEPDEQICHLWRKWVKHLMYQLELLGNNSPEQTPSLNKTLGRLHAISDYLGDHHDFAMLARQLRDQAEVLNEKAVKRVLKLIRQRQKDLLKQARKKGKQVFAEKAGVWVKMLNA